ncbi:MAG TPA: SMC family ATPase [Acidimicrobiales bacterium]|nr:SMC family ATPase [Acidimicrobiales bacterium]
MRITRLYMRNFRVYEDPVELEMPPGLVGIFGRNGAGKSTLLESITWTLWGKARTAKDQIRTSGVNADCVTEVEFEHEGHLYLVRRTLTGMNHTVKAEAQADGSQVAEGVRDVAKYVHSILGMDDVAFRASVFAEQKQLAAFSSQAPAERRKLVMQLLGITPLDGAREQSRKDARASSERLTQLRGLLPDRTELEKEVELAAAASAAATGASAAAARLADEAKAGATTLAAGLERLADVGREYDSLVKEGKALREKRDEGAARLTRLQSEAAQLAEASDRLAQLTPVAEGLDEAERRLGLVQAVTASARALTQLPPVEPAVDPDELSPGVEESRAAAEFARTELSETDGRLVAARASVQRAQEVVARTDVLTDQADCPLCGQALGDAFEKVQSHRRLELDQAEAEVTRLVEAQAVLAVAATRANGALKQQTAALEGARKAWMVYQRAAERRETAMESYRQAVDSLGGEPGEGEEEALVAAVEAGRAAAAECARLRGRLERRQAAAKEAEDESDQLATLESELINLRDKVKALDFKPEELARAREAAASASKASEQSTAEFQRLSGLALAADAALSVERHRLADADQQHERLGALAEEARHLGRLSELLNVFRNTVVASVGPTLSAQAADLFSELTDREYERLEVDPDSYEIQIRDAGVSYGMDRFSGSETDLANLALRVAISEHVRFQSGGTVGLLVLDEVFGPLDEERKERMLLALERLRGRFRQVLVVTHDAEIKEQLPSAIEVLKLPGRRATARVVNA